VIATHTLTPSPGPPPGVDISSGGGPPPGVDTSRGGYVDPNWPFPGGPNDAPVIIYGYTPSFALALLATILFSLYFLVHLYQVIRHRAAYFSTFPIGLGFEIIGYIARCLSAKVNPYNLIYFILQYFFIVTAPVFLAAGIYAVLSALIHRIPGGRGYSPLAPKVILWFFITSDAIATVTQIAGAALIGVSQTNREDPTTANYILLGGLAYQCFSIGLFIILTVTFLVRARAQIRREGRGLVLFVAAFFAATLLVYLRTVFRLAETAEGLGGGLSTVEVYFGTLEFLPLALAVPLLAVWHPGRCVGSKISAVKEDSAVELGSRGG
jgi:hypothetical protein